MRQTEGERTFDAPRDLVPVPWTDNKSTGEVQ